MLYILNMYNYICQLFLNKFFFSSECSWQGHCITPRPTQACGPRQALKQVTRARVRTFPAQSQF